MKGIVFVIVFVIVLVSSAWGQTTDYTFTLTWIDNSNNEEGFNIYRGGSKIAAVAANVQTYKDPVKGSPGQEFCYEVSAFSSGGESAKASACGKIPQIAVPVPAAPSGLTTSKLSTSSIRLAWGLNSTNESGIEISRRTWAPPANATLSVATGVSTFDDTGLTAKKTYCYKVKAKGIVGDSDYSNESCTNLR